MGRCCCCRPWNPMFSNLLTRSMMPLLILRDEEDRLVLEVSPSEIHPCDELGLLASWKFIKVGVERELSA